MQKISLKTVETSKLVGKADFLLTSLSVLIVNCAKVFMLFKLRKANQNIHVVEEVSVGTLPVIFFDFVANISKR